MKFILILLTLFFIGCNEPTQVNNLPTVNNTTVNMNYAYYGDDTIMYIPIDSLNTESMQDTIQVILGDNVIYVNLKGTAYNVNDLSYRKVDIKDTLFINDCLDEPYYTQSFEIPNSTDITYTCIAKYNNNNNEILIYITTDTNHNMNRLAYDNYEISTRKLYYDEYMFPIGE